MIATIEIAPNGCRIEANHVVGLTGCPGDVILRAHSNDEAELNSIPEVLTAAGIGTTFEQIPLTVAGKHGRLYRIPNARLRELMTYLKLSFSHDRSGDVGWQFASTTSGMCYACRWRDGKGIEREHKGEWGVFAPNLDVARLKCALRVGFFGDSGATGGVVD